MNRRLAFHKDHLGGHGTPTNSHECYARAPESQLINNMPGKKFSQGRTKKRLLAKELNENTWKPLRDLGRKANSALELAIITGLPIRAIASENSICRPQG